MTSLTPILPFQALYGRVDADTIGVINRLILENFDVEKRGCYLSVEELNTHLTQALYAPGTPGRVSLSFKELQEIVRLYRAAGWGVPCKMQKKDPNKPIPSLADQMNNGASEEDFTFQEIGFTL